MKFAYILIVIVVFVFGLLAGLYLAGHGPADLPDLVGEKIKGTQEPQEVTVILADENLAAVVRETLGMPSGEALTAADLARLRSLNASEKGISDLTGMEYCTNLSFIYLWSNQISDISPLASLAYLKHLYIYGNQISDLSPLVENSGLGEGDVVMLQNNNLDLSEGSEDLMHIQQLEARGVEVEY
jgi:Leucine-rich repeat (LRR) protein